jgi:hypothetical protein
MRSLVNALGPPVDEITEPIHPPGLRKKYPHLMRFWQARPSLIGLLIGLGICIVAFVVIAIIVSNQ